MNIMQTCLFLFWTIIVPAGAGLIIGEEEPNPAVFVSSYMRGWIILMALAEILTLPLIYFSASLNTLTVLFGAVSLLLAFLGVLHWVKRLRGTGEQGASREGTGFKKSSVSDRLRLRLGPVSPWTVLAVLLILLQIAMVCRYAHMDADDSFYLGAALTDAETNSLFSVNPYTGAPYTSATFQTRYVLSAFPDFLAVLSRLCGGVNPVLLAHKRVAAPLFLLAYAIIWNLGRRLFPGDRHAQGRFLLFVTVFIWYSAYSIYNRENFMMVRIWQGKAVLAAVMIPALLYYGYTVFGAKEKMEPWIMTLLTSAACCLTTVLGIVAAPVILGICTLIGLAAGRRDILGTYLLSILPCILIGAVYYVIR